MQWSWQVINDTQGPGSEGPIKLKGTAVSASLRVVRVRATPNNIRSPADRRGERVLGRLCQGMRGSMDYSAPA